MHPNLAPAKAKGIRESGVPESSFIQYLKYDEDNLQLTVTMKNGGEYTYFRVYPAIADDFFKSPSKGSYFANVIKGKNPNVKVVDKNIGRIKKKEM